MTFKNSRDAFLQALKDGRLCLSSPFAVDRPYPCIVDYMYMGTDATGKDLFKHIVTREYLP